MYDEVFNVIEKSLVDVRIWEMEDFEWSPKCYCVPYDTRSLGVHPSPLFVWSGEDACALVEQRAKDNLTLLRLFYAILVTPTTGH